MSKLPVRDIFKATYLWQFCNERPSLELEGKDVIFTFANSEKNIHAVRSYLSGCACNNLLDFVERYKILRSELYLLKDDRGKRS